jgi:hypothetical protein
MGPQKKGQEIRAKKEFLRSEKLGWWGHAIS